MSKVVSIHQPSYFPWLGFLDKVAKSDIFVILDTVQLNAAAYQHRNLFLDNQGKSHILTLPINKKNYKDKSIKELELSNNIWQKKHSKFIYFNYKKHPFFDEIYPLIEPIYQKEYKYLIDLLLDTLTISIESFSIKTELVIASELQEINTKKEDLVIDILKQVGAETYLSGNGAKSYQKEENFVSQGIKLEYQSFKHPTYQQINTNEFIEGMSCLDYLFNCGLQFSNIWEK